MTCSWSLHLEIIALSLDSGLWIPVPAGSSSQGPALMNDWVDTPHSQNHNWLQESLFSLLTHDDFEVRRAEQVKVVEDWVLWIERMVEAVSCCQNPVGAWQQNCVHTLPWTAPTCLELRPSDYSRASLVIAFQSLKSDTHILIWRWGVESAVLSAYSNQSEGWTPLIGFQHSLKPIGLVHSRQTKMGPQKSLCSLDYPLALWSLAQHQQPHLEMAYNCRFLGHHLRPIEVESVFSREIWEC